MSGLGIQEPIESTSVASPAISDGVAGGDVSGGLAVSLAEDVGAGEVGWGTVGRTRSRRTDRHEYGECRDPDGRPSEMWRV